MQMVQTMNHVVGSWMLVGKVLAMSTNCAFIHQTFLVYDCDKCNAISFRVREGLRSDTSRLALRLNKVSNFISASFIADSSSVYVHGSDIVSTLCPLKLDS